MSRIVKRITYNTRAINFTGTVVFASMGKYVTDFLSRFKGPGWEVTDSEEGDELECVIAVLDAMNIPTEIEPGVPYTVHGRVQAAIEHAKLRSVESKGLIYGD